ncbi:hypothetical protein GE061_015331 [Apolygus lucorum]|uniref:Uncharacterized protein n=1 Tax=Apolygus lucorum TaxID=248454 RepID=A0A6A4J0P7_APOLU|nr:hypothetical protein GE061_015331 [Apolygus lucorum]
MPRKSQKAKCIDGIVYSALQDFILAENSDDEEQVLEVCFENLYAVVGFRYGVDLTHGSVKKSRAWCTSVLPNMDQDRFRQMMRVNWAQFQTIVDLIKDDAVFKSKLQFPVEVQLMIVLYRLGSYGEGASIAKIANLFGVGDGGTVDIVTRRIFRAILALKSRFLTWMNAEERAKIVAETYDELPYCVGYIDGTEIPLAEKPVTSPDDYYSRKQRFSIKAQIVCDRHLVVRSLTVGHPGCVHDARIYALSELGRRTPDFLSNHQWIAGDSAYKLTTTLITPYKRSAGVPLPENQVRFNKIFSKYRVRVEHTFGSMKERFCSLKELKVRIIDEKSVRFVCEWFTVCVLLNNIIRTTSNDDEPFEAEDSDHETEEISEINNAYDGEAVNEGVHKREAIAELIL